MGGKNEVVEHPLFPVQQGRVWLSAGEEQRRDGAGKWSEARIYTGIFSLPASVEKITFIATNLQGIKIKPQGNCWRIEGTWENEFILRQGNSEQNCKCYLPMVDYLTIKGRKLSFGTPMIEVGPVGYHMQRNGKLEVRICCLFKAKSPV